MKCPEEFLVYSKCCVSACSVSCNCHLPLVTLVPGHGSDTFLQKRVGGRTAVWGGEELGAGGVPVLPFPEVGKVRQGPAVLQVQKKKHEINNKNPPLKPVRSL